MAFTSEQYKYLLFQRLRRHLGMNDAKHRAYTQSFFGRLFEGATVTEESYNNFVKLMDDEMIYCAENNVDMCENITSAMINEHGVLLIEAFAAIGIDLKIEEIYSGDTRIGGDATFTKQDGEVMVYQVRMGFGIDTKNYFYIYSKSQTESNYAKLSAKYYNFTDKPPLSLEEYNPMSAGPRTYWSYNPDTYTLTITGDGIFLYVPDDPQLGMGEFNTCILGSSVSTIGSGVLTCNIRRLVLLHPVDANIAVTQGAMDELDSGDMEIYCDNDVFRRFPFPGNITIHWHTLDEWDGGESEPNEYGLVYNGVFLPTFNNYKNKKNRPYVTVYRCEDGSYFISASFNAVTLDEGSTTVTFKPVLGSITGSYFIPSGKWYWTEYDEDVPASITGTPIWSNCDVLKSDGTVFLPTSAPLKDGVPMSIVARSYCGNELPELPDWNKVTYPNVLMTLEDNTYYLYCSTAKPSATIETTSASTEFKFACTVIRYKLESNEWVYNNTYSSNTVSLERTLIEWANYEMPYVFKNDKGTSYDRTHINSGETVPAYVYG